MSLVADNTGVSLCFVATMKNDTCICNLKLLHGIWLSKFLGYIFICYQKLVCVECEEGSFGHWTNLYSAVVASEYQGFKFCDVLTGNRSNEA